MKKERIHPVAFLMGVCLIAEGFFFPFCMAYISISPIFFGIIIVLSLVILFLYYLYISGENRKERKEEIMELLKENLFMRCSYHVFMMGILANLCIMISKEYGL